MALTIDAQDLIAYVDWQREKWYAFLRANNHALETHVGAHGDGRFSTVADLVKHIFSAEKRYVDRLSGRPLTDPSTIPSDDVNGLFGFGRQSRGDLLRFLDSFSPSEWDIPQEHTIAGHKLRLTPRKIMVHVLLHEIRHWAQIATLLRLSGNKVDMHDFIGSPVYGEPHMERREE